MSDQVVVHNGQLIDDLEADLQNCTDKQTRTPEYCSNILASVP